MVCCFSMICTVTGAGQFSSEVRDFNQLMTEIISARAHPGDRIDSLFLSNNGGRLQNVATAQKYPPNTGAAKFYGGKQYLRLLSAESVEDLSTRYFYFVAGIV